jgi:hypothetical protein
VKRIAIFVDPVRSTFMDRTAPLRRAIHNGEVKGFYPLCSANDNANVGIAVRLWLQQKSLLPAASRPIVSYG